MQIGDTVRVVRKTTPEEERIWSGWIDYSMDEMIGKEYQIDDISDKGTTGGWTYVHLNGWWFPAQTLYTKYKEPIEKTNIQIGSETFLLSKPIAALLSNTKT